jgi:hypothetical protein
MAALLRGMGLFAVTVSASEDAIANEKWSALNRQAEVVIL